MAAAAWQKLRDPEAEEQAQRWELLMSGALALSRQGAAALQTYWEQRVLPTLPDPDVDPWISAVAEALREGKPTPAYPLG